MPGAGRLVEIDASRLPGWVDRFAGRHGLVEITALEGGAVVRVHAADGARAEITVPYGGLPEPADEPLVKRVVEHVRRPRTIGVLLVRRAGWAVGVADAGRLVAADAGGGHVHGRTKAGGWSQQRYARRRRHQSQEVWQRAADGAAGVLAAADRQLDALVTGGDRTGVDAVLADQRLVDLRVLVERRFLDVGEPKRSLLTDVVRRLHAVVITVNELA